MSLNADLNKALQQLEEATAGLSPDETLDLIDKAIANPSNIDYQPYFEVHKARVLRTAGRVEESIDLLERCSSEHYGIDSVHYFVGEYLLELGHFARALEHLSSCIEICDTTGDSWFADAAYLLRAYCAAKIGNYHLAHQDLLKVEDDDPMTWLDVNPMVSKSAVERMIGS